jgi:hypothetical protein
MKVKFLRSYRSSKSGNVVFVYAVSGTEKELETFAAVQGEFHVVDETTGKPLWFSNKFIGDTGTLLVAQKSGKLFADMTEFDKIASLTEQYGGAFGQAIAQAATAQLFSKRAAAVTTAVEPVAETSEDLSKL